MGCRLGLAVKENALEADQTSPCGASNKNTWFGAWNALSA
jgi:hypothetical protein